MTGVVFFRTHFVRTTFLFAHMKMTYAIVHGWEITSQSNGLLPFSFELANMFGIVTILPICLHPVNHPPNDVENPTPCDHSSTQHRQSRPAILIGPLVTPQCETNAPIIYR